MCQKASLAVTFQADALALYISQTPIREESVTQCSVSNLKINKPALTCSILRNLGLTS
jgi:hypothetical protein